MATERIKPPWWLTPMYVDGQHYVVGGFPGASFMKNSGLVTDGTREEFEARAGRCAVFRFDPVTV